MKPTIKDLTELLIDLKSNIEDDYRASDEDTIPGMLVTIGSNGKDWNYQTGDNSYSGGAYGFRHWAVIYLYRCSNCRELARSAIEELRESQEINK